MVLGLVPADQRGKVPIDGIFISGSLLITQDSYFLFTQAPSDHRAVWIKIKISLAYSYVL